MEPISNSQPKQTHTARNTVIGAGIGAGAVAGLEAFAENHIIKNPDKYIKTGTETIKDEVSTKKSFFSKFLEANNKWAEEIVKSGQIDKKMVAKSGVLGAAVVGGITLTANLIKNRKSKES